MNQPRNTSGSPRSGFIYFNPEFFNRSNLEQNASQNIQQKQDTQDFLAFDNSPGQSKINQGFSPSNFSSPKFNHRNSHPSPYRYNKSPRGWGLHSYSYQGNRPHYSQNKFSGSPNGSRNFGSNQNRSWSKRGRHSKNDVSLSSNHSFHKGNTSAFYDSTCLENPWQELEKQMDEKSRIEKEESLKNNVNKDGIDQNSGESSEESSEEEDIGSSSENNEES